MTAQLEPIPVAVLGPTGYTGLELLELLARHAGFRITYLGSSREHPPRIDAEFPRLLGRMGDTDPQCRSIDHDAIARAARLAFLCLPHEAAMTHTPELLRRGVRVVDLSAAYRLRDPELYARVYGHPHTDPGGLARAVYGLTELFRSELRAAALVANPGCYPTACTLALVPLLRQRLIEPGSIIINAASGVSGAGREPKPHTTLVEAGENYSAYAIGVHRHQPEILQTLRAVEPSVQVLFVPHLLPVERGILETIYATPCAGVESRELTGALREAYANERFISVREEAPTLRDVQRTNMVHVNARVVCGRAVIVAAVDNLTKGAAGQAVQNANVMFGLGEGEGLQGACERTPAGRRA